MSYKFVKVLIIEDGRLELELLDELVSNHLKKLDLKSLVKPATTEKEAYQLLSREKFDIVIFDIDLDKRGAGLRLLKQFSSQVPFSIISTARQSNEVVARGYDYGCDHFIYKPVKEDKIKILIEDFVKTAQAEKIKNLINSKFVTKDEETLEQIYKIPDVGESAVLINGPTGVGKQVLAELIHGINNSENHFLEQNCSEIQESLASSFLFGHKKGSFTGALKDQKGIFERADGGTIFLDEIDKTSLSFQAKLLKVIEQKIVEPIGAEQKTKVEFRLITASSGNLESLVSDGKFLPDLFERLQGETILIKPLSERVCDIEQQIEFFMKKHSSGRLFNFSNKAMKALRTYDWPGNSRELQSLIDKLQRRKVKVVELEHLGALRNKVIRCKYKFTNSQLIKAVKEEGLPQVIEELTKELVDYYYEQNFKNTRKTMRELDVSSRFFYKHLNQEKEGKLKNGS